MNRPTRSPLNVMRLQNASKKVRTESMRVNVVFAAFERAPDTPSRIKSKTPSKKCSTSIKREADSTEF